MSLSPSGGKRRITAEHGAAASSGLELQPEPPLEVPRKIVERAVELALGITQLTCQPDHRRMRRGIPDEIKRAGVQVASLDRLIERGLVGGSRNDGLRGSG